MTDANKEEYKSFLIRMPKSMLDELDRIIKKDPWLKSTRNSWLLRVINDAIALEKQK